MGFKKVSHWEFYRLPYAKRFARLLVQCVRVRTGHFFKRLILFMWLILCYRPYLVTSFCLFCFVQWIGISRIGFIFRKCDARTNLKRNEEGQCKMKHYGYLSRICGLSLSWSVFMQWEQFFAEIFFINRGDVQRGQLRNYLVYTLLIFLALSHWLHSLFH